MELAVLDAISKKAFPGLLLVFLVLSFFGYLGSEAQHLAPDEVEALKEIGKTLRKTWNFSVDPCSGRLGWNMTTKNETVDSVICNCFPNNVCHVEKITLEYNHVSGVLPPDLGNMTSIERFFISSNNFTGPLPESLAKLTTLKDFRINDNHFSGKIPDFLQNWINLERIEMQASGLDGPIPSGISQLTNMKDMRFSDLGGIEYGFPNLTRMHKMTRIILRSCNIVGKIPDYLGKMTNVTHLDLSFNKLTGEIPSSFSRKTSPDIRYRIDLSYNNFTFVSSDSPKCQERTLFQSFSMGNNSTGVDPCVKDISCPRRPHNSFHINCGGKKVSYGRTTYMDDISGAGDSRYFQSAYHWAFSSTGRFLDNAQSTDIYIATNISELTMKDPQLYINARLAPTSLTYYGFCLQNGNYTVKLHFAEIMFTNDNTFKSLGRRIFNIYIQGKLVKKDFNIEDEAGGVGKEIILNFAAVVTGPTLNIRFYWAGKGTTGIPFKGTYGPLVSAISVYPDFKVSSGNKISSGVIVGIVISVLVIILGIFWWKGWIARKSKMDQDPRGVGLHTGYFTLRQIKDATDNFDVANKIGEGGFGPVYKGHLPDGTLIAVKQLSSRSNQGNREFVNEIGLISSLHHPNLVKLYGWCMEGNQLLLVYEYMENNSLANALFGEDKCQLKLNWPTRHKICVGLARALAYLHEESRLKIVHRDIKSTNVLLDKDLNTKVSDFGLAKLCEEDTSHISTRIAGTIGYMAPEYAMKGHLTDKADVYSFGIVALEIVSGRNNTDYRAKEECVYLLEWALFVQENGDILDLVDSRLESNYVKEEVVEMINVALQCASTSPSLRPTMSSVVSMLEGRTNVPKFVPDSSFSVDDMKVRDDTNHCHLSQGQTSSESHTPHMLIDEFQISSPTSCIELQPINPNSRYWKNRDKSSPF